MYILNMLAMIMRISGKADMFPMTKLAECEARQLETLINNVIVTAGQS